MTQEDIIELARQAGFIPEKDSDITVRELEAFAKLVQERAAAKERERIKEENQRCYVARGQK